MSEEQSEVSTKKGETKGIGKGNAEGSKATQFKKGAPGRPKGSVNHYTRLKRAIVKAVDGAAEKYGAGMTREEYLAELCAADPMDFLRIAARVMPREIRAEIHDRVIIVEAGDEDCRTETSDDAIETDSDLD